MIPHDLQAVEAICSRLTERRATLFLGAGANFGIRNSEGKDCPLGQQLANYIARDVLHVEESNLLLDEVAEIARLKVGARALNDYLFKLFNSFSSGPLHLALVQLPWDSVFTTNYDLYVENAATAESVAAAGRFRQVFSLATDLSDLTEDDIPYYKLHGSIDFANTEEGRLILTKEDYRYYEEFRRPLFRRLKSDLLSHTFVFLGYSLGDPNFRAILEDARQQLGTSSFPRSFAIRKGATEIEQTFWREKYNIEVLNLDGLDFINLLKGTWFAQKCQVIPFDDRRTQQYLKVDNHTSFAKIGESFYHVRPDDCHKGCNADRFFKGGEPTWGDIANKVAPLRDSYGTLLDGMFEELLDASHAGSVLVLTGAAGTGKTTLLRTLAYDIAVDTKCPVLVHIPGTPFDAKCLGTLVDPHAPERIVIFIHHAAERVRLLDQFIAEVRRLKIPATFVLEERKNQWGVALSQNRVTFSASEVEVGATLSDREIRSILEALRKHNALGKLTGATEEQQLAHFERLYDKELLVALRELTTLSDFDEIIKDEYSKIPSPVAQQAYVYVSALGQLDLPIRFETLQHLLGIDYEDFGKLVLQPTEGVLLSLENFGHSRHNAGFRVKARHPVIASVIFATAAPDDEAKFNIINAIIDELDPGYVDDAKLLEGITRNKALVNTLASPHMRRAVYDRLEKVLPGNAYVYQHRSILERSLDNAEGAIFYARKAVARESRNPAFANSLGLALEFAARSAPPIQRDALLSEASKIFESGIRTNRFDAFSYLGQVYIQRQKLSREFDYSRRRSIQAEILSLLEEAYESTNESDVIAGELAKEKDNIGSTQEALDVLREGLTKKPTNDRLRGLLVRMQADLGKTEEALKVALEGERLDPTAWRIQRQIARLKRTLEHPNEAIKGYYEAAMRHNQGDPELLAEYGAFLMMTGQLSEAAEVFERGRQLKITTAERNAIREYWLDNGRERKTFSGKVAEIRGAVGFVVAIPENFRAMYWRTRSGRLADLKRGDAVRFQVAFTAQGPRAEVRF
jgi:tetratricopeptide (TPR) repeat protein